MEDQFELGDLRQYMNGRPHFPSVPPPGDIFSGHRNLTQAQHYEMVMVGTRQMSEIVPHGLQDQFRSDCTTPSVTCTSTAGSLNGLETEVAGGGDGGTGRWPRQETLTLLEIRSRLDSKFKEANQKGPLWDEVSRILSEEHGYQRSGKKCREKFENLYKYYKKTKEGKAGRQDGKNYRFFRQLEALYGETSNTTVPISETHHVGNSFTFLNSINNSTTSQPNQETFQAPKLSESLSLTSSSEFNSSSSDDINDVNDSTEKMKKRRGRRSWKGKIKDFIESQMRKLMEKQEAWLDKMMKTLERKEQERMMREEEWRKQEKARIDGEHKFWANERAWIEARDSALMKALQKFTEKEGLKASNAIENGNETISSTLERDSWVECEITRLIQLRTSLESKFEQGGCSEEALWEEIAAKMACLGYDRSGLMCKEKWDSINIFLRQTNKKRKENSRSCYFENNDLLYNQQGGTYGEINEQASETTRSIATNGGDLPTNSNGANVMNDGCFRLYMGDGENLWENYGMKISKGENN